MTAPLKVMVGPSGHYHQLKSGQIKYQKGKPAKPIWRILVLDEPRNKMHSRAFSSQPSAGEIQQVILGVLQDQDLPSTDIYIPATVEKLCPGLQEKLMSLGAAVYPNGCTELSLRGVPAHNHLEKMVQELSGGRVTVIPHLVDLQLKTYYHPVTPAFLRTGGAFHSPYFAYRTPLSPAQCLISTVKAGPQRMEGLLMILAILPKETATYVPIGDAALAERMTGLINERLARTGKGVTCHVGPVETYGELMEIGPPA